MSMKKVFATLSFILAFSFNTAQAEGVSLEHADVDVFDELSVLRGAGHFANYCLGCHGLKLIRYSRISKDLKINESAMRQSFMFGDVKFHDPVRSSMPAQAANEAFGVAPPDLSLVVRSRGADWVYSYLKGFYVDGKRPFGVNNVLLPNVAMPNVLWELQGDQVPVIEHHNGEAVVTGVELAGHGKLTEREFEGVLTDLVNFLAYVGEPSQLQRIPLGKYVIFFLLGLTYILYLLKKEYWKDID